MTKKKKIGKKMKRITKMDELQTIYEIKKYPLLYIDEAIKALIKERGEETAKVYIQLGIKTALESLNKK